MTDLRPPLEHRRRGAPRPVVCWPAELLRAITDDVHGLDPDAFDAPDLADAGTELLLELTARLSGRPIAPRTSTRQVLTLVEVAVQAATYDMEAHGVVAGAATLAEDVCTTVAAVLLGAVGISWPTGEMCLDHIVTAARDGRLRQLLHPGAGDTYGRLIFTGDRPPECPFCAELGA